MTTRHTPGFEREGFSNRYSPGPWIAKGGSVFRNHGLATVASCIFHDDARLIAAAPELLAALETITKEYELALTEIGKPWRWGDMPIQQARAAIARATGGEE